MAAGRASASVGAGIGQQRPRVLERGGAVVARQHASELADPLFTSEDVHPSDRAPVALDLVHPEVAVGEGVARLPGCLARGRRKGCMTRGSGLMQAS